MNAIQKTLFDYQKLDTETSIIVQQRTTEIKALMKRTAQDIIEIGEKLIEVKDRLPHGEFGGWLEAEFEWSYPTANRFMNVATQFKSISVIDLDIQAKALYLLAAPSTPDEARQAAIERAVVGERITYSAAKNIVDHHKNGNDSIPEYTPNWLGGGYSSELNEAIVDEFKPVCAECGQVYDGDRCPDCNKLFNYKRDNKAAKIEDIYTPKGYDACQTPPYAFYPLEKYIDKSMTIWEPAKGEGYLTEAIINIGFDIVISDILTGNNFFEYEPEKWDCLVTNPPFSIKYKWLERCYQLGKPFALLLPVETLGAATSQSLFSQYGLELILLNKRVNFKMPNKGWDGGGAQFPVAWFTWGFNIGQQLIFEKIEYSD